MAGGGYEVRWLPVSVAADMLMVSRQRVYELISGGKLQAMKFGSTTLVSRESVNIRILGQSKKLEGK